MRRGGVVLTLVGAMLCLTMLLGSLTQKPVEPAPPRLLTPGFPSCEGTADEHGFWQPYLSSSLHGRLKVGIAITTIDVLDASTVICWLDPEGLIQALPKPGKPGEHL